MKLFSELLLKRGWWRHSCLDETFSSSLALCEGNPLVTGGFPPTKASDAEIWCFLWSVAEQTVEQTIDTPVIWDAIARSLWHHRNVTLCLRVWLTLCGLVYGVKQLGYGWLRQWTGVYRGQAITWTNLELSTAGPLETKLSEIWIQLQTSLLKEMNLKKSSAKRWLLCPCPKLLRWMT